MFHTLGHVLPSNRRYTDEYLFHSSFWRIELLLRSTRSISSKIILDPNLSTMSESYERVEEERLVTNLQDIAYELDSPATVSLITGGRRIERVSQIFVHITKYTGLWEFSMFSLSFIFFFNAT